jgi:RHS repeat-associated protein
MTVITQRQSRATNRTRWRTITALLCVLATVGAVSPTVAFAQRPRPDKTVVRAHNATPRFNKPMPFRRTKPVHGHLRDLAAEPTAEPVAITHNMAALDPAPDEGWTVGSHWLQHGDGSYTGEFYVGPEFRQVAGTWLPIDPTLTLGLGGLVASPGSLVPLTFGLDTGHLTTFALPDGTVTESLSGTPLPAVPLPLGQTITYAGIAANTDLQMTVTNGGVKEALVLNSAAAPTTFHFHLADPSGALGAVDETAPETFQFANPVAPDTYLELPHPFAFEQEGASEPQAPDLDSAHQSVVAAGDGFDVTLSIDPSWLAGKSFPIVLDPPVTWINTTFHVLEFLKYSTGHSGCGTAGDACIGYEPSATQPNALGAGTQTEKVGTTYVADARPARVDYYFAISAIRSGSSITSAVLNLYNNGCIGYSEFNCDSNTYREQWFPLTDTVDTTTTYHDFDARSGSVLNSTSLLAAFPPGTRRQFSWGIVNILKYWIGTDPNNRAHLDYGFGQKLDNEPTSGNIGGPSFAGPNDTADPHPSVVVDWVPPPGQMTAPTLASTSNTSLRATFSPPSTDNTSIDSYKVDLYTSSNSLVTSTTCGSTCTSATFTGLPYDSYYVVAEAHNAAAGYGPTSAHSNTVVLSPAPQLTKTLLTTATNGYYGRGQLLRYKLHIVNPGPNVMAVSSVTDNVPGQIVATGAVPSLNGVGCSSCSVSGNTIAASNLTVPGTSSGQNWIDLAYSVVASGAERGCTTVTNTATATNSFGSSTSSVPVTICDSGLGVEPWWSYVSSIVGAQSTAQVNAMNGNLVVQATDSTPVPARGHFDYVIRRTYNSQDAAVLTLPGSLGGGWLLNVGQADDLAGDGVTTTGLSVPQPVNEGPGPLLAPLAVTMIDRDGTRHVFTYRSASVGVGTAVNVGNMTGASALLLPANPKLLPTGLGGSSGFASVCVDAMYQPPPGVHVALWRYVGVNSGCANELTDNSARVVGFSAVRPDRLRYDYDPTGRLLDMTDGSGVDLRYGYDTSVPPRLTSVYEARTCSTPGVNGCRGITITYPSSTETDVTDPAGRVTKYLFDGAVPVTHLIQVVNPPQTGGAGTGSITTDNVQYAYQGFNATSCGAATGQLCRITDARGNTTTFSYTSQTLGLPRVTGITDRRGTNTTITYNDTANPPYVDADTGSHRTEYAAIDTSGRVGEIDQGNLMSDWLRRTSNVWDTTGAPCTYVAGRLKGSFTTWKRQENNLCQVVRSVTATTTETTKYTYAPEGTMLSSQQVMNGQGADRYATYAYAVQYVRSGGQSSITGSDSMAGGGDVILASRSSALGDGGSVTGDPSVLYSISDLVASTSPNGNVTGATVNNYTTHYTRANNASATPDVATSNSCTSRNSGLLCTVATPYQGATQSSTTYAYDSYGQKTSATVPRAANESPPSGQGTQYVYTYYPAGAKDLSNTVSTEGWLEAVTDPANHFVAYAYDQAGNRVRTWDRNATNGSFDPTTFVASGNTRYAQSLYAANTSTKPWRYPLSARDPIGNTVTYTRDADGNALTTKSARNKTTTEVFDQADNVTSVTTPLESANAATFTYDLLGNLTSSKSPNGAYTVRTYDTVNHLTGVYTDRGPTATTTNPGGTCADSTTAPRPPIPSGEIVCATLTNYDLADNVTSTQSADGAVTTYTYDPANRRVTTVVPRSTGVSYTTTTVYDADGNVTDVCPPRQTVEGGTSGCPATGLYSVHHTYTEADRLLTTTTYRAAPPTTHGTRAVTPATQTVTTTYGYDLDGNLTLTTDPNGHPMSATYDFLDRRITETRQRVSGQPATTVYTYDPAGNVTAVTRPGSQSLGDTSGGTLTVSSGVYVLPSTNVSYQSITLTGGATLVAPATGGAVALTINVTGTVNVCAGCSIVVDGRGQDGGQPNTALNQPGGNGAGSGGGTGGGFGASAGGGGGGGSYSTLGTAGTTTTGGGSTGGAGATYGSDTFPDVGSGGGAGGSTPLAAGGAGGAGGGFVHLSADNIVLNGTISAQGAAGSAGATSTGQTGGGGGGGSGGGIWLTAPTISGVGGINVNGAAGYTGTANGGGSGGAGRVRVDADSQTATGLIGYPTHRLGLLTAYSYDADNRLIDTVLGADNPIAASAGLVDNSGGSNVRTRIAYDADGNVAARYEPRAFASSTTTPDPRYEQVTTYDDDGRVAATYMPYADAGSDPLNGPATSSQCDTGTAYANADPNASTDHVGDYANSLMRICKTTYSYDHNSNRVTVVLPTSAATKATPGSDLRSITYTYTPDNLLLTQSIPNPTATVASSRVTEHQYSYDGAGRVVQDKQLTAQAPATVTSYTLDGLVSTVTPPAGPTGLSHQISYGYDSNGDRTSVTTHVDASTTRTSYTDYNSDGTVLAEVDPAGNTTSNSYDAAGNPTAVYSPNANVGDVTANPNHLPTTYSYFDDNLLRTSSTPVLANGSKSRLTTYGYDAGGRKLTVDIDYTGTGAVNGAPQTFSYFADDRLSGSGGRGSGTQTYAYDPAGDMTTGTDNSGGSTVTTTATYYLNGLPRTASENSATTTYSYDATGATAAMQSTTGAGTITSAYGYTDAEQPATVTGGTLGAGVTMSIGYDDEQRPVTASYPSGPTQSRTWNADSTLQAQTLTAQGGGSVSTWNYGYDGMGRVTYAANNTASTDCVPGQPAAGLQCFTYDAAGRLATFHDTSAARSMSYDPDGNRTGYGPGVVAGVPCVPASGVVCAKYNPDDSISQQSTGAAWNSYLYAQPFGGVTNDGCSTFAYDGFDRMSTTSGITGTTCAGKGTTEAYDILDRQARRTDTSPGGMTTTLGYAGLSTQATSEATSSGTTRYTLSADGGTPLAVSTTGGVAQYLFDDGRGNISTTTSTSGSRLCDLRYDPWGSFVGAVTSDGCTNAGGTTPSDMFYGAGRRDASTGTYQLGSRTYDPAKAGFLNPDGYRTAPSSADLSVGTDPLTRDTYNYVNGDPINLVDPSGHMNAAEGGGGCGKLSNADCRRIEDYVANAVMVEYLNQAYTAGVAQEQAAERAAEKRRHQCDGFLGSVKCMANDVADVATTGAKVGVNFVGGVGAGLVDEATSIVTFGTYDPGFSGCTFGGGGVVGGACTAGRVTGRVGAELVALAGSGGAAGALDAVRAGRAVQIVSNIASKARIISKLRSAETVVGDVAKAERAAEDTVDLYRAVGVREYNAVTKSGKFMPAANSLEGRQFARSFDEALRYADTDSSKVAIFKATIARGALDAFDFSKSIDPFIFKNGVVTVQPGLQSDIFHEALLGIEHVL